MEKIVALLLFLELGVTIFGTGHYCFWLNRVREEIVALLLFLKLGVTIFGTGRNTVRHTYMGQNLHNGHTHWRKIIFLFLGLSFQPVQEQM